MNNKINAASAAQPESAKKFRLYIALTAAATAVLLCIAAAAAVLSNSKYIYTAAAYLIPQSYTETESGITFYREEANASGTENEEELLEAYKYYYIDSGGEKVYLTSGVYRCISASGEQMNVGVSMGFVLLAVAKIRKIVKAFKIIIAVLSICITAGIIKIAADISARKKPRAKKYK